MKNHIKHLDRAFSEPPEALSEAVEQAFMRGEAAMKRRHKFVVTLTAAAAVAVICAAMGFAANRLVRTVLDETVQVVASDSKFNAAKQEKTTKPTSTHVPQAEAAAAANYDTKGNPIYYATTQGNYFHTDEHCSGMQGALPTMADAAMSAGKAPCPVCVTGQMQLCWSTEMGTYYHKDRECMGMWTAVCRTVGYAQGQGQTPCPVCWKSE